ncbi:class I SAM-dependent methyltransferase [Candidatus Marinamargulisbacteria bacterium SCGC AG-333-B06]|nr:class I SAM-dependent methyltransferase [Candidatus Marinamargulisbacteria bacterium SCGC AG-333-B06]
MNQTQKKVKLKDFKKIKDTLFTIEHTHINNEQNINKDIFSKNWVSVDKFEQMEKIEKWQFKWYLSLYGFKSEIRFKEFLQDKDVILDAGCGLGYKAAWFARLNPNATVIGMDISESVIIAAEKYKDLSNLIFIQGDLAKTGLEDSCIDYLSCDQVLHHTENPNNTLKEFSRITKTEKEMALYVYKKKGIPRELLDEYFISGERTLSYTEREELSEQLTRLGKTLSDLKCKINVPDIPALNIKGGEYDLQRFIYWNFLKCYWNEEQGFDISKSTNVDWYTPAIAFRYNKKEFLNMTQKNKLETIFFHEEEAAYSGRFKNVKIS